MPVTKTDRISLNGVWTDALTLRSGSGNAQGFWVPPRIVERGDSLSFVLSAMSAAKLLFEGTLPPDRAQVFPVRIDHRVLGKYVLEGLEPGGSLDSVRLVLRRVEAATADEQPVSHDLGVLSAQSWGALCMDAATGELIRIACSGAKELVPGESVRIRVRNSWTKGKTCFVSGELEQPVVDVARLRLKPLALTRLGDWDPAEDAWHDQDEVPAWWRAIVNRGPRPEYELEDVLPAADNDPILQAIAYRDAGDPKLARATLLALLEKDLRCIDAHVHLGNFAFDKHPKRALRHYEVGIAIGEQALGSTFDGVLPWGVVENRSFLRCMHGYGVTAWKLGRFQEAAAMFRRMLWINPADQQGIRLIVEDAERGRRWTP